MLIQNSTTVTHYFHFAKLRKIVDGKMLLLVKRVVKSSKCLHTTLTAVVYWLNLKAFAASCQYLSFQQNIIHVLAQATRTKSFSV
ncbi:hypothetical protein D3C87_1627280 [compost metagenome]